MFTRLLVLFVTVSLAELFLLLKLNELTGSAITTIGLILLTGFVGAWLTKQQGLSTLARIRKVSAEGKMPAAEFVDGAMILVAAALLVTPGMLTDTFGFSLLIPACRTVYRKVLKKYFPKPNIQFSYRGPSQQTSSDPFDPNVVDGEARSVQDDKRALSED